MHNTSDRCGARTCHNLSCSHSHNRRTCNYGRGLPVHRGCSRRLPFPHRGKSFPIGGCGYHTSTVLRRLPLPGWAQSACVPSSTPHPSYRSNTR